MNTGDNKGDIASVFNWYIFNKNNELNYLNNKFQIYKFLIKK